jgi:hypothetical protein
MPLKSLQNKPPLHTNKRWGFFPHHFLLDNTQRMRYCIFIKTTQTKENLAMHKLKYAFKTCEEVKEIRKTVTKFSDTKIHAVPVYGYTNIFDVSVIVRGNIPDCLKNTVSIRNALKSFC